MPPATSTCPSGATQKPTICNVEQLRRASISLGRPGVRIVREAFSSVLETAGPGDFVYLDPPYAPVGASSDFTSYTAGGFSPADQRELQQVIIELARRGCQVLLSNSTAAEIRDLYDENDDARRAGLRAIKVPARRAINSNARKRGRGDGVRRHECRAGDRASEALSHVSAAQSPSPPVALSDHRKAAGVIGSGSGPSSRSQPSSRSSAQPSSRPAPVHQSPSRPVPKRPAKISGHVNRVPRRGGSG